MKSWNGKATPTAAAQTAAPAAQARMQRAASTTQTTAAPAQNVPPARQGHTWPQPGAISKPTTARSAAATPNTASGPAPGHTLTLQSRSALSLTGVRRVLYCEEQSARFDTACGLLTLSGAQLSILSLDLDAGLAQLSGRVDALEYTEPRTPGGWLRRLAR